MSWHGGEEDEGRGWSQVKVALGPFTSIGDRCQEKCELRLCKLKGRKEVEFLLLKGFLWLSTEPGASPTLPVWTEVDGCPSHVGNFTMPPLFGDLGWTFFFFFFFAWLVYQYYTQRPRGRAATAQHTLGSGMSLLRKPT